VKKILNMISVILALISCLPCAFALDEVEDEDQEIWLIQEDDADIVKTIGQYGDLVIQEIPAKKEIYLYDTKQGETLFRRPTEEEGAQMDGDGFVYDLHNSLFFTKDGRILHSAWRQAGESVKDIQTFELSPDGTKETLLTTEYAIEKQDLVGRFICMTEGHGISGQFSQGVPDAYGMAAVELDDSELCKHGIFDEKFDKILIPFDFTRWDTYTGCIVCGYPEFNDPIGTGYEPKEGRLNAVTLDWIVPVSKVFYGMEFDWEPFQHGWFNWNGQAYFFDAHGSTVQEEIPEGTDVIFDSKTNAYRMLRDSIRPENYSEKWAKISEWATDGVAEAKSLDLLPEQLQTLYQYPISRRNFCHLLIQTLGKIAPQMVEDAIKPAKDVQFFDVETRARNYPGEPCYIPPCSRHICLATALGVVTGYEDKTFRPENLITRQEAAAMLNRMLKVLEVDTPQGEAPKYADGDKIGSWAMEDVNAVSAAGIMNGVGEEKFSPEDTYTLEQSVLTMLRIYNLSETYGESQPDSIYTVTEDTASSLITPD